MLGPTSFSTKSSRRLALRSPISSSRCSAANRLIEPCRRLIVSGVSVMAIHSPVGTEAPRRRIDRLRRLHAHEHDLLEEIHARAASLVERDGLLAGRAGFKDRRDALEAV